MHGEPLPGEEELLSSEPVAGSLLLLQGVECPIELSVPGWTQAGATRSKHLPDNRQSLDTIRGGGCWATRGLDLPWGFREAENACFPSGWPEGERPTTTAGCLCWTCAETEAYEGVNLLLSVSWKSNLVS